MRPVVFSTALLVVAAASAQEPPSEAQAPLAAAFRDAQHLAECTKAMDAACVTALSDVESYRRLNNGVEYDYAAAMSRVFAKMQKRGYKILKFDVLAPHALYVDGGRLYMFVPYSKSSNWDNQVITSDSHLIGLSRDGGDSWTFVYVGEDLSPARVRLIIPSYSGQPLE